MPTPTAAPTERDALSGFMMAALRLAAEAFRRLAKHDDRDQLRRQFSGLAGLMFDDHPEDKDSR